MLAVPPIAPLHHESFPTWKKICFPPALVYCLISYILTVLIFCCCRQHIFRLTSLQLSLQIRIQTSIFYIILNNSGFVGLVKRLLVKNFMSFCKWTWTMAGQKLFFFLKMGLVPQHLRNKISKSRIRTGPISAGPDLQISVHLLGKSKHK